MKYFAYGSNMAIGRLRERAPSVRFVGVYKLKKYELRFHKVGRDGSAKCNAFFTGSNADVVEGAVFAIDSMDIASLDDAESYGYEKKNVQVINSNEERLKVFTYVGTKLNESLVPFSWYKNHVLIGAQTAGLSPGYTEKIKKIKAIKDPEQAREQEEYRIHEQ